MAQTLRYCGACTLLLGFLVLMGCATSGDRITDNDTLTMGAIIDDNDLENRIRSGLLAADERFADARVNVLSYNARILITGRVPDANMINSATEVVRQFNRVRLLHNELRVGDPPSASIRSTDQWLSVRVKGAMVAARDFPSRRVVITTDEGRVYLMGLVSREQGRQAELITASVEGVQRVVSIFDYTD